MSVINQFMHSPTEFKSMAWGICELAKVANERLKAVDDNSIRLYCNNIGTINTAYDPAQHDRATHIEVDKHFIKEKLESSLIYMLLITQKNN